MTFKPDSPPPEPPRMAGWLLTLFTPADLTESITGDLLEEFSGLAIKPGLAFARGWYRRQVFRTIVDAGGNAFRIAPLLMAVAVIAGYWLTGFATRNTVHAMQMFLDSRRIYESHPDAYLFWLKFPLEMGRVLLCAVIGALVAFVAKRIEMIAVMALVLIQSALFVAGTLTLIANGRDWFHWFLVMLPWNVLGYIATVTGGVVLRSYRSHTTRRSAA